MVVRIQWNPNQDGQGTTQGESGKGLARKKSKGTHRETRKVVLHRGTRGKNVAQVGPCKKLCDTVVLAEK